MNTYLLGESFELSLYKRYWGRSNFKDKQTNNNYLFSISIASLSVRQIVTDIPIFVILKILST